MLTTSLTRVVMVSVMFAWSTSLLLAEEPCAMRESHNLCLGCECGDCDLPEERDAWNPVALGPDFMYLKVRFVVFCLNNGTSCVATQQQIDNQLEELNTAFEDYGIQFDKGMTDTFVNSTTFRTFCPGGNNCYCPESPADCIDPIFEIPLATEGWLKQAHAVDPDVMLNIYVTACPTAVASGGTDTSRGGRIHPSGSTAS